MTVRMLERQGSWYLSPRGCKAQDRGTNDVVSEAEGLEAPWRVTGMSPC
jgi:hypothetical protein